MYPTHNTCLQSRRPFFLHTAVPLQARPSFSPTQGAAGGSAPRNVGRKEGRDLKATQHVSKSGVRSPFTRSLPYSRVLFFPTHRARRGEGRGGSAPRNVCRWKRGTGLEGYTTHTFAGAVSGQVVVVWIAGQARHPKPGVIARPLARLGVEAVLGPLAVCVWRQGRQTRGFQIS